MNNKIAQNIRSAIKFLKGLPHEKFISFSDLDNQFGFDIGFSKKFLKRYFLIVSDEKFIDNNNYYYTYKGISKFLNYSESKIKKIIIKNRCGYLKIYHQIKDRLFITKFFNLSQIITCFSRNIQLRYDLLTKNEGNFRYEYGILLREILYCDADLELTNEEKIIFYALLIYRDNFGVFPTLLKLSNFIQKYSTYIFSIQNIEKYLCSIERKKYLTMYKTTSNKLDYIIHLGPISLLYKECICLFPNSLRRRIMYAPKDFVNPPPL